MSEIAIIDRFSEKLSDRSLSIAVVGLGYVGLPTAMAFHKVGFKVTGIDISEQLISSLSSANDVSDEFGNVIPRGENWLVTSDYASAVPDIDIAIVCVPTPVDQSNKPDLSPVRSALDSIIGTMVEGQELVIVLESTVQPGTTRDSVSKSLGGREFNEAGIMIAYCPERVSPGEGGFGVSEVGRVVGSDHTNLTLMLSELYGLITSGEVLPVDSIEVAEASKLVENAQRDIDIAFVNELSILLPKMGLDVEKVLEAADTKWNFHRHTPGLGVGGHCIPIDPYYYIEIAHRFGVKSALSPAARELNSSMPLHNLNELEKLCDGSIPDRILILGYSYKPNVSDSRETPVEPFVRLLIESGCKEAFIWDPVIEEPPETQGSWVEDVFSLHNLDCVVVATAHDETLDLDWMELIRRTAVPRIYDARRCLDKEKFESMGWDFHAIGIPR